MKQLAVFIGVCIGFALGTVISAPKADGPRPLDAEVQREKKVAKEPEAPADDHEWGIVSFPPKSGDLMVVVYSVIDGDTVEGGFITGPVKFRLHGIDAPEMNTPEGKKAKEYLDGLMPGYIFHARLHGTDKFGRALADVWLPKKKAWVSTLLKDAGHAVPYDGGKRE